MKIIDLSHNSDTAPFLGDKRAEINVSQNWLAEIDSGIEAANTFLFVIHQQGLRKHKHKHVNGAPPQMLIGSYNARF